MILRRESNPKKHEFPTVSIGGGGALKIPPGGIWGLAPPPPPDPTQSSEAETVQGLCWHNRPRERKGE